MNPTANSKLKSLLQYDVKAGFIVFLIALPLSIGIALASGAPASAGLIAAAVGGILGSLLGGSEVTINGPAAGLIVIVLGAVESLGNGDHAVGFRYALAAIAAAGLLQILMGVLRLAKIGLAFPSSVVHGMLSAIGGIIIVKQMHVLLGEKAAAHSIFGLILELPHSIAHLNPDVAGIGLASLATVILWPKFAAGPFKRIPAALVAVLLGIALGRYFDLEHEHIVHFLGWNAQVDRKALLDVPMSLKDSFLLPDFGIFFTWKNLVAVVSITLIASIESVLSTFAVDRLDPMKRSADLNRDLWSKGICNFICGMIGGLPIISEIVRSSANVTSGARTRVANFSHGIFILVFLLFFPGLLHMIPLASLAAILISVGWRLCQPSHFGHAYRIGPDHAAAFVLTFLVTLASDLLVGVLSGVVLEFVLAWINGRRFSDLFTLKTEISTDADKCVIQVHSPAVFANSLKLRQVLEEQLHKGSSVVLDLRRSCVVDHTVFDQVERFQADFASANLSLEPLLSEEQKPLSSHRLATRRTESSAR